MLVVLHFCLLFYIIICIIAHKNADENADGNADGIRAKEGLIHIKRIQNP